MIIFLSKGAVAHEGFFQKKLNLALDTAKEKPEGTIFIIPVRLEECEVPMRLLPYHYVDYFGTDAEKQRVFENLILSLKSRADGLDIKTVELNYCVLCMDVNPDYCSCQYFDCLKFKKQYMHPSIRPLA